MEHNVITSGYVSMDHIIKIMTPLQIGYTSLVKNADNVRPYYGGCVVNIAVNLCRLGIKATPLIRVGGDWEENGFKKFLIDAGVSVDWIKVLPEEATSTCYLLQDNNNDHVTVFYPGAMDKKYAEPFPNECFEGAELGVITVGSKPDNRFFFEQCKKHGVPIAFSMKDDFDAFPVEFLKELLNESLIIFTNEVERSIIERLYGCSSMESLLNNGKTKYLVTTLGREGSICYEKTDDGEIKEHRVGICSVESVVDATGAGDAYVSGFLAGYLEGKTVPECMRMGTALSSLIIEQSGCCIEEKRLESFQERIESLS